MSDPGPDLAAKLLEQHVKHELAALKGAKLRKFLDREVTELLRLADSVTLARLSSVDQIMGVFHRVVVDLAPADAVPDMLTALATAVLQAPVQADTRVGDLIDRDQFEALVEELVQLRQQRERMIAEMMAHPIYQDLVASLVYNGLVNYLYEDNLFAKSVPGVGSMMKFGKKMANRAVPGLDETFERRIKAWLADSLPGLIARSEQFLNQAVTDDELRHGANAMWRALEGCTIADLRDGLGDLELQELAAPGHEFWLRFRNTDYFEGCVRAVVEHVFEQYGDQPIAVLLQGLGVTHELIMAEVDGLALPFMDVLREEGYLEALVRRRLSSFYQSAAVRKLLSPEA